MASDLKRSPSFSLRKSFESTRFRRKHADSTATAPDVDPPPPPVPALPRAATTHFEEPKPEYPRLSKRKSVRNFFNNALTTRTTRKGTPRTRAEQDGPHRASRVVNFSALQEQPHHVSRHDKADDFSFEPSTIRSSAYSGSDTFKPLAAHPPPARMATVKEEHHIRLLREAELRRMFFGAPQFSVVGTRDYPKPEATYRDQDPDSTQDGRDFVDFHHSSFELATLQSIDGDGYLGHLGSATGVIEMPSMLGLHGLEPGTVGLDRFLQIPLSHPQDPSKVPTAYPKRQVLQSDPESLGLRAPQLEHFIDRLSELGHLQARRDDAGSDINEQINEQKASEMYADLFSKLLTPPKYSASSDDDPTGINVQIMAIVKALNLSDLWYDLSDPDERLRLGQIVWAAQGEAGSVEVVVNRNILFLQITLAAELLTMLELSQNGSDQGLEDESLQRRAPKISRKVAWDLVLAKRFLQDVCISPGTVDDKTTRDPNRSSLFSMLSFVTAREDFEEDEEIQPILHPRNEKAQLNGLLSFATALEWPHLDELTKKITSRIRENEDTARKSYTTPIGTPAFKPDDRDSYFGVLVRPHAGGTTTSQPVQLLPPVHLEQPGGLNAAGWLSRSWLTGLVMPGESSSHLLISSLLENSPDALAALGDTANLTGGFIYQSRSYWSKSCIVGRVLSALPTSRDCMGWISTPAPAPASTQRNGWLNISSLPRSSSPPRIKSPHLLSLSTAYPDPKTTSLTEQDFVYPTDGAPVLGNALGQHILTFNPDPTTFELPTPQAHPSGNDSLDAETPRTITPTPTVQAVLSFSAQRGTTLAHPDVPLRYDVHFLSAQPCFPRARGTPGGTPKTGGGGGGGGTPSGPRQSDTRAESSRTTTTTTTTTDKALPPPPCHPLLGAYGYEIVPVLAVLGDDERVAPFEEAGGVENDDDDDADDEEDEEGDDGDDDDDDGAEGPVGRGQGRERQDSGPGRSPIIGGKREDEKEDRRKKKKEKKKKKKKTTTTTTRTARTTRETGKEKILVLDCRGEGELQLLARAWCAKVGEHAIVARGERTCLACCVREARGAGVRVAIRI
ncbi:hypothetical protein CAC42_6583 [Sphaceloma murrayae]|uniref:Uncharacterized protein n=1 Tax=Sphaceloma murrayae TaxID=2082308 RepID=A0A2K1QGR0_9PEZI|nr:hypothetical protein CAC42_6583 [Sphaceloma murrayae]